MSLPGIGLVEMRISQTSGDPSLRINRNSILLHSKGEFLQDTSIKKYLGGFTSPFYVFRTFVNLYGA